VLDWVLHNLHACITVILSFFLSLSLPVSLNTRCQNFKVRLMSPCCRFEADWLKMCRGTNVIYCVARPISGKSHDPRTLATMVATRRNSQNGSWRTGTKLYIKNLYEFQTKPLHLREAWSPGSNLEWAASRQSFGNLTSFERATMVPGATEKNSLQEQTE
jgi:hypothetical protein